MATNGSKKSPDNQSSDLPQIGKIEEYNDTTKLAELAAENKLLKAEIQKLLDEKSKESKFTTNIPTQNRFEALDSTASTSAIQDIEMVAHEPTDFAVYLKKKNNQQEINSKGKSRYLSKSEEPRKKNIITHSQAKDPQEDPQKIRRKDRLPPINVLYQDSRDIPGLNC